MLAVSGGLQLARQLAFQTTTRARRRSAARGVVVAAAAQPLPSGGSEPSQQGEACRLRYVVGVEVEDGSGGREELRCHSGAMLLRDVMQENLVAVDLYRHWGKTWQCGGSGKCAACVVKVNKGHELLSQRTDIEKQALQDRTSCRLACQAWVGNGRNSGSIHLSLDIT